MREIKFTPGPWEVGNTSKDTPKYATGKFVGKDGIDGIFILISPSFKVDESRSYEMECNANLISSAPELYKALKSLESGFDINVWTNSQISELQNDIKKALAKAEGRL